MRNLRRARRRAFLRRHFNLGIPRRRIIDRSNPLEQYSDYMFACRYRFSKVVFLQLLTEVGDHLINPDQRGNPLPPLHQLLMFLRFAATGSFQEVIGDTVYLDCAKSTVCKYLPRVARVLATIRGRFIKFRPTPETVQKFKKSGDFLIW